MSGYFYVSWLSTLLICMWPLYTNSTHPSYYDDNMGRQEKDKMIWMTDEIVVDSKIKQRQVQGVREIHAEFLTYEVGLVIGKMGEKYKRMMEIYRQMYDRWWNKDKVMPMPPAIFRFKPIHYINSMELVHTLESDIDKMIHVLQFINMKDLAKTIRTIWKSDARNPPEYTAESGSNSSSPDFDPKLPKLRTSEIDNNNVLTPKPRFNNQDELKLFYREQFEAKSGRSSNWTLDQYYGFT